MALQQHVPRVHSMRNSRRAWCCLLIWIVVVMVSIDVSTATWSPHQHPTTETTRHHSYHLNGDKLRGGSTKLQPPPPPPPSSQREYQEQQPQESELVQRHSSHYHEEKPFVPKISLNQVAKALLHTSEWNRRLLQGVKHWGRHRNHILSSQSHYYIEHKNQNNAGRDTAQHTVYGSGTPVNVHPSRAWHPHIQASSGRFLEEEELSLFHAKKSRSQSSLEELEDEDTNGVDHWGPELLPYLEHIVELLGIDKNGIEICLAMIYMDRACSVGTQRSNGVPSCPFCSPRTVHRLSLAALLVSIQAVRGEPAPHTTGDDYFSRLSESLGIPPVQLEQMVDWMRGALGDGGLYVTLEEMKRWNRSWESIFS